MTEDIDWEVEMEALDASLPRRLERAAQMAERSDIWTDTERLMPATGVADLIWEAHSEILGWRALNEERKASRTCPLGEDCDLTVAWMAGRKSAKDEAQAMVAAALEEAAAVGDYFADMDYAAMHYPEEGGLAASGTAHEIRQQIRAMIPDAGAALDRALEKARAGINLTPQPIETAPMDGTKILVFPCSDTDEIQVSWFIEEEDRWANWNWSSDPTHWMPKPDFAELKENQ